MCVINEKYTGTVIMGQKIDTNGVDWGIWWVGGPLMGARTMAIICNLSYQAHIYTYFARLINSTLGGGNFFLPYRLWYHKGKGPNDRGEPVVSYK